jgi:hypothetical protein
MSTNLKENSFNNLMNLSNKRVEKEIISSKIKRKKALINSLLKAGT